MVSGIIAFMVAGIIVVSVTSTRRPDVGQGRVVLPVVGPLQKSVAQSVRFLKDIWGDYFFLVSAAEENEHLKQALSLSIEKNNQLKELALSNQRLRNLLDFKKTVQWWSIAAEVVGKDPSPWFKTIIVDKGKSDGVVSGLPVVSHEGIAGLITESSSRFSKVLLLIDQNSAIDALDQRTRARGIIQGGGNGQFKFKYVLRKHDVRTGDTVVSSGLDGAFPKGIRIGEVSAVVKGNSGIFQEVTVTPYVDFEKLEEVLILFNTPEPTAGSGQ